MKCYVLRDHLEKAAWPGVFGKQKAQGLITSLSTFYLGDMWPWNLITHKIDYHVAILKVIKI